MRTKRTVSVAAMALAVLLIAATAAAAGYLTPDLKDAKKALKPYKAAAAAVVAGYAATDECVAVPGVGGMGFHYVNFGLIGDQAVDPANPEVLLYASKGGSGKRKLVAAEWLVLALVDGTGAPWMHATDPPAAGFSTPVPRLFGVDFEGPMPGHDPAMPWHYDRHAWLFKKNPGGVFADFNPKVKC